jgi:hypothetical protein
LGTSRVERVEKPLAIVVGSGRSGTSLLAAMLDSHPDLSMAPESHFLPELIEALPDTVSSTSHVDRMLGIMQRSKWFAIWLERDYDTDGLRHELESALPLPRSEALQLIYRVWAASKGKTRYGEKTPAYVYNLPLLAGEFVDARFIHIIRDGRNVALSFREASFGDDVIERSMLQWQRRVLDGHRAGEALGRDRYIEVLYERLIDDTEGELRRLCDFLDLPFDAAMLGYHERDGLWKPRMAESRHLADPPKHTRSWQDQLTPREHARLELLGATALATWGYELTSTPTVTDRIAAWRARAQWWYYRFKSKTGLARRFRREPPRKVGGG